MTFIIFTSYTWQAGRLAAHVLVFIVHIGEQRASLAFFLLPFGIFSFRFSFLQHTIHANLIVLKRLLYPAIHIVCCVFVAISLLLLLFTLFSLLVTIAYPFVSFFISLISGEISIFMCILSNGSRKLKCSFLTSALQTKTSKTKRVSRIM